MRKLIFDFISVEVTRRCNMNCRHCLRGNAQEVDIDFSVIDALAEQSAQIYTLTFTGGEPTLNVPAIAHTLDALRRRNVPVTSMRMITNGALHSRELVEIVREFSDYIARWKDPDSCVCVQVSDDRYHIGVEPRAAVDFYRRELAGAAEVEIVRAGESPLAIGRGRVLASAQEPPISGRVPHKIETLELGKPYACPVQHLWPDIQAGEKVVCCRLNLSAHGDLSLSLSDSGEYAADDRRRDLVVCNLSQDTCDIERSITEFNRKFPSCRAAKEREEVMQMEEYAKHPRQIIEDFRRAYHTMQQNPAAKDVLLRQYPGLEGQFALFLGMLDVIELLPDEQLRRLVTRQPLQGQ